MLPSLDECSTAWCFGEIESSGDYTRASRAARFARPLVHFRMLYAARDLADFRPERSASERKITGKPCHDRRRKEKGMKTLKRKWMAYVRTPSGDREFVNRLSTIAEAFGREAWTYATASQPWAGGSVR